MRHLKAQVAARGQSHQYDAALAASADYDDDDDDDNDVNGSLRVAPSEKYDERIRSSDEKAKADQRDLLD